MSDELSVIVHCYNLQVWTLNHTAKFNRSHRFTLGERMESKLHELMDYLVEAKFTREKAEILRKAALRVEQVRLLFRLRRDIGLLSLKSHHFAAQAVDEIGREIGGWRKRPGRSR